MQTFQRQVIHKVQVQVRDGVFIHGAGYRFRFRGVNRKTHDYASVLPGVLEQDFTFIPAARAEQTLQNEK